MFSLATVTARKVLSVSALLFLISSELSLTSVVVRSYESGTEVEALSFKIREAQAPEEASVPQTVEGTLIEGTRVDEGTPVAVEPPVVTGIPFVPLSIGRPVETSIDEVEAMHIPKVEATPILVGEDGIAVGRPISVGETTAVSRPVGEDRNIKFYNAIALIILIVVVAAVVIGTDPWLRSAPSQV